MRWLALALVSIGCDGLGHPVVAEKKDPPVAGFSCLDKYTDCLTRFVPALPFPRPVEVVPSCVEPCNLLPVPTSMYDLKARHTALSLHADQPTTLEFHDVDLSDVAIDLSGPITLLMDGKLDKVSIFGDGDVTLSDSDLDALAVKLTSGSLRIQRSTLDLSVIQVPDLTLETIELRTLDLTAQRMVGIELNGTSLRLDVGDLSLSHIDVTDLQLHHCDNALFVDTRLGSPKIGACSELLRAHSASFTDGIAQGKIESVGTYWGNMLVGAGGADTSVDYEGSTLSRVVLCPNLQHLSITPSTSVWCADCRELPNPELRLCIRNETDTRLTTPIDAADAGAATDAARLMGQNDACPIFDEGLPLCQ